MGSATSAVRALRGVSIGRNFSTETSHREPVPAVSASGQILFLAIIIIIPDYQIYVWMGPALSKVKHHQANGWMKSTGTLCPSPPDITNPCDAIWSAKVTSPHSTTACTSSTSAESKLPKGQTPPEMLPAGNVQREKGENARPRH